MSVKKIVIDNGKKYKADIKKVVERSRQKGFTQGVGCAIHYVSQMNEAVAENLFREMNESLEEYEKVCDEIDLPAIRKAAGK